MISFIQFLCEAITRDDLIAHYDEVHKRRADSLDSAKRNPERPTGGFKADEQEGNFYSHNLDPKKLATLPGRNGEHKYVNQKGTWWHNEMTKVKNDMQKNGFRKKIETTDGYEYQSGVMVRVKNDGKPVIHEGNKRLRSAAQLGHRTVPVRWEWEGTTSHDKTTSHPVDFMHDDDLKSMRMKIRAKRLGIHND